MIVRMQKVTLLLSTRVREEALRRLRELGVLHIKYVQPPQSEDIQTLETRLSDLDEALLIIPETGPEGTPEPKPAGQREDPLLHIKHAIGRAQARNTLAGELDEYRQIHGWYERWGDISHNSLEELREAGLIIRLYIADRRSVKNLPPEKVIHIVKETSGAVYFAYFAESPIDRLNFREELVPQIEPDELRDLIGKFESQIAEIDDSIAELAAIRGELIEFRCELEKRLEHDRVLNGMGEEERFVYLQGFCPADAVGGVKEAADQEGWAYAIEDPDDPDEVPTLIRNPKWLRIIEPLFKFLGTLPGYAEYDISLWFLLFFSLFFAMIVSDAGYGLVFLALAVFTRRKARSAPPEPFLLIYALSGATIVWGLLSGNWFGYEGIGRLPLLNLAVIDQINAFSDSNQFFLMYLCFLIGVIHLSVAHAVRAFRIFNSPVALAELGWIAILWSLFFVAGDLVIERAMPGFTLILFAIGFLLVLVFANFQKNILKAMLITLGDLPLTVISSFSDVVSYLRLFAVGYASVTVAASFNEMALGSGISSLVAGLAAAITLFLGHSLNILLCLMGVIVHGVRLNMLEFSGQMSMQWSGRDYRPFKE